MLVDLSVEPTSVDCHQVKTKKSGYWTIGSLVSGSKESSTSTFSIIGKLYQSKKIFDNHISSLNFVSNAHFYIQKQSGKGKQFCTDEICAANLNCADQKDIEDAVNVEHNTNSGKDIINLLFLRVSNLSLEDHETHVKGKLSEFLESVYPGANLNLKLIYEAIFSEIRRKTNFTGKMAISDLHCKSISRQDFENIIQVVGIKKNRRIPQERIHR